MKNTELFKNVIEHFGEKHQLVKFMEECAEAQVEIAKYLNDNDLIQGRRAALIGELADLKIMLNQMIFLFGEEYFQEVYLQKVERLKFRAFSQE